MLYPEIDKPHLEKKGCVVLDRMWTYEELERTLAFVLKREGFYDDLDYFQISFGPKPTDSLPKDIYRIVVYAVEGSNEGHYVHVDVIARNYNDTAIIGKTFLGWDHALKVSNALANAIYSPAEEYRFNMPIAA